MMKSILLSAAAVFAALSFAPAASAQCTDARITAGFQANLHRAPSAAECTNLLAASKVCQDPWIAQAYYVLSISSNPGLMLNGHSPLQLDGGRAGSTAQQCNTTFYGSWPDFTTLVSNVNKYLHPSAPPPAAGVSVSLGLPGVMQNAQPVTISWTYTGTPSNCGSGLVLVLNGSGISNYQWARIPSLTGTKSMSIQMLDWSKSMAAGSHPMQLSMLDLCTSKVVSPVYNTAVNIAAPPPPPPPTPKPQTVTVSSFQLITRMGSRCLQVQKNGAGQQNVAPGTALVQADCLPGDYGQQFGFMPNGQIEVFRGDGGLCVDEQGGLQHSGDHVIIWPCSQSSSRWTFGGGAIRTQAGLCLDLFGGWVGSILGSNQWAQIYSCNGQDQQSWVGGVVAAKGATTGDIASGTRITITPHGGSTTAVIGVNGSAIVASGAGNIVASGAGNIVASGAGNIVASGAGNVITPMFNGIVASGAGN